MRGGRGGGARNKERRIELVSKISIPLTTSFTSARSARTSSEKTGGRSIPSSWNEDTTTTNIPPLPGGGWGGLAGFVPYVQIPGFNLGGQGKEEWLSTVSVVVVAVFSFRG